MTGEQQAHLLDSLGRLAAGIAHDYDDLLAVILNYTAFVVERVEAAAAEPGGEAWRATAGDLRAITAAANHATRLTRQLLAFGRRDAVRPEVVDLNAVVRDVDPLLGRTLGQRVVLATSLADDLWPICADAGSLERLLVDLADNARDAMPDGGTFGIDTANVETDAPETPGRYVRLRASDTGVGMAADVVARAFEPFFTTKRDAPGLGLAAVYGVVVRAGGIAEVCSEPGIGTTVTALFPAIDAVVPAASAAPAFTDGHETVLVVEEDAAVREVTCRALSRAGYDVVTAATGADVIRLLLRRDLAVDLLVTDVVMPGMLGTEVVHRVRAVHPDVRVVFLSGHAQPVLALRGCGPGAALVEKPFSAPQLLTVVRTALDA